MNMDEISRSNFGTETHRNLLTHEKFRTYKEEFKKAEIVLKLNKSLNEFILNKKIFFCIVSPNKI